MRGFEDHVNYDTLDIGVLDNTVNCDTFDIKVYEDNVKYDTLDIGILEFTVKMHAF